MTSESDKAESVRATDNKPIILVIDDNPRYASLFELLADRLGVRVTVVNSCEEGMSAMEKLSFDIVIMDWLMPEVDGLACTKKIRLRERKDGNRATIIGVSGYVNATHKACVDAGMDDFLEIPFTIDELHEKLFSWMEKNKKTKDRV